jgi:hypothetical protein
VAERPQPLKGNLCWLLSQATHGLKTELTFDPSCRRA